MPGQGRNHLQLAGIGFADAWLGLEASATCWNWICRCLARVGSICNLLKLELQMPDQGWNHLQFVVYEFADTYPGVGSICNLLELDLQMPITKLILRILQQLRWDCFFMSKKSKMFL